MQKFVGSGVPISSQIQSYGSTKDIVIHKVVSVAYDRLVQICDQIYSHLDGLVLSSKQQYKSEGGAVRELDVYRAKHFEIKILPNRETLSPKQY